MTLRQRILSLMAHGDYDPVLVAAVLDIDVSVVAATLTDPAYTPVEPGIVDLGVVRSTDLIHGKTVLYTPSGRDYVAITPGPDDFQTPDHGAVSIASDISGENEIYSPDTANPYRAGYLPGQLYAAAPFYALLTTQGAGGVRVETAPPAWAATHEYANHSLIVGPDDHFWASDQGITDGSIPDFAGNEGGSVTDGSVIWTDAGPVPTTGAIHLYAIVTPLG